MLEKITDEQIKNRESKLGRLFINHPVIATGFIFVGLSLVSLGITEGTKYILGIREKPIITQLIEYIRINYSKNYKN